jgi:predicted 2-oxoglutarate/Fe(II)-dependent dioxygenase YbiX
MPLVSILLNFGSVIVSPVCAIMGGELQFTQCRLKPDCVKPPVFPLHAGDRLPDIELPAAGGEPRKLYWAFRGEPVALLAAASTAALEAIDVAGLAAKCKAHAVPLVGICSDAASSGDMLFVLHDTQRKMIDVLLAPEQPGGQAVTTRLLLLDTNQRLLAALAGPTPEATAKLLSVEIARAKHDEPAPELVQGTAPPVLILPRVFEPALCQSLIALWHGSERDETGVSSRYGNVSMAEAKRTEDHMVSDPTAIRAISDRLAYRVGPELLRGFGYDQPFAFDAHVILSYSAEEKHYFKAHRDNGAPQTVDRAFAVSLNLNEDYEGGELIFPEYGRLRFKPPAGAAAVFSCTLLHEALPVTRGRRYVLTSFFRPREAS